eukprot:COSAG02_NODE_663_length_18741_cov_9.083682_2_plen_96_part_00
MARDNGELRHAHAALGAQRPPERSRPWPAVEACPERTMWPSPQSSSTPFPPAVTQFASASAGVVRGTLIPVTAFMLPANEDHLLASEAHISSSSS